MNALYLRCFGLYSRVSPGRHDIIGAGIRLIRKEGTSSNKERERKSRGMEERLIGSNIAAYKGIRSNGSSNKL